jgi:hypothetical protein
MNIEAQIEDHIAAQPAPKADDMRALHRLILGVAPDARLWFLDGKDASGKSVTNPDIGYGFQTMKLAGGKTRDFYQVGFSANAAGISIYLIGLADRKVLAETWGKRLGKASVTGYCIKFKALKDIDTDVLKEVIRFGLEPRP